MLYGRKSVCFHGKEFVMRSPSSGDEETLLNYLKAVSGETDYMIRYPEEITMTASEEKEFLETSYEKSTIN